MKAVILAAGKGVRMGQLTAVTPKPLLRIGGKTFLERIFDSLPKEVSDVIVVIGFGGEMIRTYLGDCYKGRKVIYVEQENLNGTAHAVLLAKPYLVGSSERFFVIHGDELPSSQEMRECLSHRYSWLCHRLTCSIPTGIVRLNSRGRIVSVREQRFGFKPPCLSVGGVVLVDANIFDYRPRKHKKTGEFYFTAMLAPFTRKYPMYAVMGAPDLYFSTEEDIDRFNKEC